MADSSATRFAFLTAFFGKSTMYLTPAVTRIFVARSRTGCGSLRASRSLFSTMTAPTAGAVAAAAPPAKAPPARAAGRKDAAGERSAAAPDVKPLPKAGDPPPSGTNTSSTGLLLFWSLPRPPPEKSGVESPPSRMMVSPVAGSKSACFSLTAWSWQMESDQARSVPIFVEPTISETRRCHIPLCWLLAGCIAAEVKVLS